MLFVFRFQTPLSHVSSTAPIWQGAREERLHRSGRRRKDLRRRSGGGQEGGVQDVQARLCVGGGGLFPFGWPRPLSPSRPARRLVSGAGAVEPAEWPASRPVELRLLGRRRPRRSRGVCRSPVGPGRLPAQTLRGDLAQGRGSRSLRRDLRPAAPYPRPCAVLALGMEARRIETPGPNSSFTF